MWVKRFIVIALDGPFYNVHNWYVYKKSNQMGKCDDFIKVCLIIERNRCEFSVSIVCFVIIQGKYKVWHEKKNIIVITLLV